MSKPSWVSLSKSSGTGKSTVNVVASGNTGSSRSGSMKVKTASGLNKDVTINQERGFEWTFFCIGSWKVQNNGTISLPIRSGNIYISFGFQDYGTPWKTSLLSGLEENDIPSKSSASLGYSSVILTNKPPYENTMVTKVTFQFYGLDNRFFLSQIGSNVRGALRLEKNGNFFILDAKDFHKDGSASNPEWVWEKSSGLFALNNNDKITLSSDTLVVLNA